MAWALEFTNGVMTPASSIPALATPVANFTVTCKFKVTTLDGNHQRIFGAYEVNGLSQDYFALDINGEGDLLFSCGAHDQGRVVTTPATVDTYYELVATGTGLDTNTINTNAGTVTVTLNGSNIGSFTPSNRAFFNATYSPFQFIGGRPRPIAPLTIEQPFRGLIFELGWEYDGTSHYWTAEASDRSNTGQNPVLTATVGAVDIVKHNDDGTFPTDGSAWVESSAGADTRAPVWTSDPALSATTDTGHSFQFTLDEDSTAYGVRLASGATAPSASQIIAGTDASDVALGASDKWTGSVTAATERTSSFSQGAISTTYDYYFAAQDAAGNNSLVKSATATTGAGSITVDGGTVTAGSGFSGTYTGIGSLSSPITLTDTAGNSINVAITDDADGTYSNATMPALPTSGSAASVLFGTLTISGSA